jgi:hypothetical protein
MYWLLILLNGRTVKVNGLRQIGLNSVLERSQISGSLPKPKANLAETHQDKEPAPKLKSTTNVLVPRTKIQTFPGKQDSNIQMYPKTDLDVRNSAVRMY